MMGQGPKGPKAAALLETIPKVDHLQADNGRERKCTEDPAHARAALCPPGTAMSNLCACMPSGTVCPQAHGDLGCFCLAEHSVGPESCVQV